MSQEGSLDKQISTSITWEQGSNPTLMKKKKKKKGKKVNVEVKCESFFNIFCTLDPENKPPAEEKDNDDDEGMDADDEFS